MLVQRKKVLISFRIREDCIGCGVCLKKCPWSAIFGERKQVHIIEPTICQGCGTCWYACPRCAIEDVNGDVRKKIHKAQAPKAAIDNSACVGCQNCRFNCEQDAITYKSVFINGYCTVDTERCVGCGSCQSYCVGDCISLKQME